MHEPWPLASVITIYIHVHIQYACVRICMYSQVYLHARFLTRKFLGMALCSTYAVHPHPDMSHNPWMLLMPHHVLESLSTYYQDHSAGISSSPCTATAPNIATSSSLLTSTACAIGMPACCMRAKRAHFEREPAPSAMLCCCHASITVWAVSPKGPCTCAGGSAESAARASASLGGACHCLAPSGCRYLHWSRAQA